MTGYYKLSPTGNITALVCAPVEPALRSAIAAEIMERDGEIEQLGFLEAPESGADIALRMAGGEFCGNASLSAAALHLRCNGLSRGELKLSVSGVPHLISVSMRALDQGEYEGTVDMPLPLWVRETELGGVSRPVLRFPGLAHVIIEEGMSEAEAEANIRPWCRALGAEALGLMLLSGNELRPLVYVPGSDTLFWEHSCASGSAAAAAWLALPDGGGEFEFDQPGGVLRVRVTVENGCLSSIKLSGRVKILGEIV